jgi:hypothetical protein
MIILSAGRLGTVITARGTHAVLYALRSWLGWLHKAKDFFEMGLNADELALRNLF